MLRSTKRLPVFVLESPGGWTWKNWQYTNDEETLTQRDLTALRDDFIDQEKEQLVPLFQALWAKEITLHQWQREFRKLVIRAHATEYMLGVGGRKRMTIEDEARIRERVFELFELEQGFAQDIADGRYSEAAVGGAIVRAGLYLATATALHEQGKVEGTGLPRLSQYPADGQTQCQNNCRCWLRIAQDTLNYYVYWELDLNPTVKHCPDCLNLAALWMPLVISKF